MSDWSLVAKPFNVLPEPFPELFSEEEMSAILKAIRRTINVKFSKDEDVPKTILLDLFGFPKTMKTTVTPRIEQVAKRSGLKAFCPPETAEVEEVRSKLTSDPLLMQATHLNGVEAYILNCAYHPRLHLVILSRGLIDMLYWYEMDRRKGTYTDEFCDIMNNSIYRLLKKDLVDSFIFCTCSVETAIKREYEGSLTQERGSKMNEKSIAESYDIYQTVLDGVNKNVPGLPIFHVDTSDMDVKEMGMEIMRLILPTICRRFNVPSPEFMHLSPTLARKVVKHMLNFEEQLKLKGLPNEADLEALGWVLIGECEQEDTYLDPKPDNELSTDKFDEILRIRKDNKGLRYILKGPSQNNVLSYRSPLTFYINEERASEMMKWYRIITVIKKYRKYFQFGPSTPNSHFFTLHVDKVEGLGYFTEIRGWGSSDNTHTDELFSLATQLGFNLSDLVEGSYLSLALKTNGVGHE